MSSHPPISPGIRYLALFVAVFTWFLILVGGIVHGTGSSLACPDWPTCYGTFFPEMKGGVFFEHSHRIVAATTGCLTVMLCILLFMKGTGPFKKAGVAAVFLVIFQGVLGGITVIYRLPTAVSTAHLATSMLFLCLMVGIAFNAFPLANGAIASTKQLRSWLLPTLILVYLQIVLGALVRHTGAGLACFDIPLCQGSLWPDQAPPIVKLHMLHRIGGLVVATAVFAASLQVWRAAKHSRFLRVLALLAPLLVAAQIGLGLWSIHSLLGLFPVTAHLGTGAWLLVDLLLMNLYVARIERAHRAAATTLLPKSLGTAALQVME